MLEKTEGHSKMDNPDKLETLGTQDTGRRETKQKHKIGNQTYIQDMVIDKGHGHKETQMLISLLR
jgi:hypothetical protein